LGWVKMEINVYPQRNRFRGGLSANTLKYILWQTYPNKDKISIHSLQLDHIVPYLLSLDSSLNNLQLLTPTEHKIKTLKDKKIIRILIQKGFVERVTQFWYILKLPLEEIRKEYFTALTGLTDLSI